MRSATLILAAVLLATSCYFCAETGLEIAQASPLDDLVPANHPQIDNELSQFIEELDIDGLLSEAGMPHSAATEELQTLIDQIESITADDYSENLKEEHLDFVELNVDL